MDSFRYDRNLVWIKDIQISLRDFLDCFSGVSIYFKKKFICKSLVLIDLGVCLIFFKKKVD